MFNINIIQFFSIKIFIIKKYFQILSILAVLILAAFLNRTLYAQKSTVEPDFELEEKEKKQENTNIEEKEIIIKGDDEQLLENRKKESSDLNPDDNKNIDWQEAKDEITHKKKQGVKKIEKRSQVSTEYGRYNSFGVHIYLTKKDTDGIYLLEYTRKKIDEEGVGGSLVNNSENSSDNLKLVAGFDLSDAYKLIVKTDYIDNFYGLQNNTSFEQQFKRAGIFETQLFRQSADQKLSFDLNGIMAGSSVSPKTLAENTASFSKIDGQVDWQYIWAARSALNIGGNLWYGENKTYQSATNQLYRVGKFYASNSWPLFRKFVGEEKNIWQMDAAIGVQVFFAQNMQPVFGPRLTVDSFYGNWRSKLSLQRRGRLPSYIDTVINQPYFKPQHYTAPEDAWLTEWSNSINLKKDLSVNFTLGFDYYNTYYNPTLQSDNLYDRTATTFRYPYGKASVEQNINTEVFYEVGLKYEQQLDNVNLRPQISGFLKSHYTPDKFDFSAELEYRGSSNSSITIQDAAVLLTLAVDRKLNDTVSLYVRGENLFNVNYLVVAPYETSGLKVFGGLRILF